MKTRKKSLEAICKSSLFACDCFSEETMTGTILSIVCEKVRLYDNKPIGANLLDHFETIGVISVENV